MAAIAFGLQCHRRLHKYIHARPFTGAAAAVRVQNPQMPKWTSEGNTIVWTKKGNNTIIGTKS